VFDDVAAAAELLGALTGHASLRILCLQGNDVEPADRAAVGAALGALVAANAPALTHLDVSFCNLRTNGLRALLEALPRNSHLRTLDCTYNDMSVAFARKVLLPAVRANASLRTLHAAEGWQLMTETADALARRTRHATEAERIVNSRAEA
jgi:hypothetical protein